MKSTRPVVLKNCTINTGQVFVLEKGTELPLEIEQRFYHSLSAEGIIKEDNNAT